MLQRSFFVVETGAHIHPSESKNRIGIRVIGQTHADETATDGIKPCETVRRTVRRNFSFPVITKKSP